MYPRRELPGGQLWPLGAARTPEGTVGPESRTQPSACVPPSAGGPGIRGPPWRPVPKRAVRQRGGASRGHYLQEPHGLNARVQRLGAGLRNVEQVLHQVHALLSTDEGDGHDPLGDVGGGGARVRVRGGHQDREVGQIGNFVLEVICPRL